MHLLTTKRRAVNDDYKEEPLILSLQGGDLQPLSVRAKALVFSDPASAALLKYIERIAPSEAPVLINGETGTGKELVARHIHLLSGRKGPFRPRSRLFYRRHW
jgi:transcriptional regulator with GAF, ATPase, and Fis domain